MDFLEQVTHEHECFQASVDEFQLWLKAVVERVDGCMGRKCRLSIQNRLLALQVTPHESLLEEGGMLRAGGSLLGFIY